ncbi:MAG: hypothetical protein H6733_10195 [Alphaproteobacteria bacterium]|nr:hypothetical protein [Alphaproteobacteria bacterium]
MDTGLVRTSHVIDPGVGAEITDTWVDSGVVDVSTSGAATTITLGIPDGALILAYVFVVVEDISGMDSDTGTFAMTGGSTQSLPTIDTFTAGVGNKGLTAGLAVSGAVANASFTLSGGSDNIASAGSVRMLVHYRTLADLD